MKLSRALTPVAVLLVGFCISCGGSSEESSAVEGLKESAADVTEEAQQVTEEAAETLEGAAEAIKNEIAEKEDELAKIAEEIKKLSPAELAGEKGIELKEKSDALTKEIRTLKDKLAEAVE